MNSLTRGKKAKAGKLLIQRKFAEAKVLLERVCQIDRGDIESWINLVKINTQLGDPIATEKCCKAIISLRPDIYEAHFQLGQAHLFKGEYGAAAACFRHVLRHQPNNHLAIFQLGKTFQKKAQFLDALAYYRRALEIIPNFTEAYDSIGGVLQYQGDIEGAEQNYRMAVQSSPNFDKAHSDLVFAMNYNPRHSAAAIFHEHVRWGQMHILPPVTLPDFSDDLDPARRLRVGYISPDFRKHSVAFFFEPLIANHDLDKTEIYCYSDVAQPDEVTQRLQMAASHWRMILGMSHRQVAEQIRQDGIDILVDLTGHTANSRLLVFSARPAPIQVTYLGYPNTTGVPAVDYRLTDAWADPLGITDEFHTETLIRLPQGFLCYLPASYAPPVSRLPAATNAYITFGSFNNLAKITPEVVDLWVSILHAVPTSRLVIKNGSLSDTPTRNHYLQLFVKQGIDPARLDLLSHIYANDEHLGTYGQIDIGLDTFPYNGTTTTCEALWMGVPVITLANSMHAGRVGVSLLSQIGYDNLIAETTKDYLQIAVELASDCDKLANLRAGLRDRMGQSFLCDGEAFARKVEQTYQGMWASYCAQTSIKK
jgi:predicted O-linked N-acetylglucosamine transferase (SPINDLY family)